MSELTPDNTADDVTASQAGAEETTPNLPRATGLSQLPAYSRSLLKIKVPVRVVLASRKENLKDVVEVAPGSIIKFDKACDELLHLHVGDQCVAEGEAVKIGDKFGFRILSMLMPKEQFLKARGKKAS
ncbi:MAG: FliM/FliN family flagellar motor switch protein [Aeoliella sp.]